MTRYLKLFLLLPLAAAALSAPALALDANYAEIVEGCRANISTDQLSPKKAEECIKTFHDNPAILERLKEDPDQDAAGILAYNSALKDYKKLIISYKDFDLFQQYTRIMDGGTCPLCDLELGPKPERSFDWAGKYLPADKTADFKFSVRSWEALGPVRTPALTAAGRSQAEWNGQEILERYRALATWSRSMAAQIMAIPAKDYPDKTALARIIPVLQDDVFDQTIKTKLDEYIKASGVKPVKTGPSAAAKASKEKVAKTAAAAAALKGMSTDDQAGKLEDFFNGTGHRPADGLDAKTGAKAAPKKYAYTPLSPADISNLGPRLLTQKADGSLSGPLAQEIKGTKSGDEILAFYKDKGFKGSGTNTLAFGFEPMSKGLFGGWNWAREDIKLNSELVNDWMKKNKVTPDMLFTGDPDKNKHLAGLSEYLAPTLVHESTHQRQTAKDKREGIDLFKYGSKSNSYYQMEKETEAFSMDASFTAEKYAKRGKAYAERLDSFDKSNMDVFLKQGVDGIRLSNHKAYDTKDSLDGEAAKQFVMAKSTSMRLQALQAKKAENPSSLTAAEKADLEKLKTEMNSKFKWYSVTMSDSVEAEKKINEWREETRLKLSKNRSIKEKPVPTLLSP
ncbi:MAG: hypothetical protein A2X35_09740 [Elusimicrobia bacterium GWA2_61_42]|nr:MAG: hypothetical protein A2X35_09740 [Elusimicrobia bacterium GWA2_61_42]OGR76448.1 MAG: hypothetical protein A2X38_12265 [Elusimicrobia bacterium GWC2_61_25]